MPNIHFGFWEKFREESKKSRKSNRPSPTSPIFTLAPMADVTDAAFRRIIAKYGKPDVMWTEFVSADGLCSPGREILLRDLVYDESERPIVAQLFTANPNSMFEAAQIVAKLGFDGLDINMGCPDRKVEKQGAGAALMKNPALAKELIEAACRGTETYARKKGTTQASVAIPVSVKTRLCYNTCDVDNKKEMEKWIGFLLEQNLPALTVHLRTRKEMSDVPAHWEFLPDIVRLRDTIQDKAGIPLDQRTLIIGNGDVVDLSDARKKISESGADGIMFGRAIFGNPWLFGNAHERNHTISERLQVMVEHTLLFEKLLGDVKSFATMKKHYKSYVNGWRGAKELRVQLMEAQSAHEVEDIVGKALQEVIHKH